MGVVRQHAHNESYTETMADDEAQEPEVEIDQTAELSPMQMAAVSMHELYQSYLFAGFNDDQAMYLLVETMGNGIHELRENIDDEED